MREALIEIPGGMIVSQIESFQKSWNEQPNIFYKIGFALLYYFGIYGANLARGGLPLFLMIPVIVIWGVMGILRKQIPVTFFEYVVVCLYMSAWMWTLYEFVQYMDREGISL